MGHLRRGGIKPGPPVARVAGGAAAVCWVCSPCFPASSPLRSLVPAAQLVSDLARHCFLRSDTFSAGEGGASPGVGGSSPASVPETRGSDGPGARAWAPGV